jgi:hypothetical protein
VPANGVTFVMLSVLYKTAFKWRGFNCHKYFEHSSQLKGGAKSSYLEFKRKRGWRHEAKKKKELNHYITVSAKFCCSHWSPSYPYNTQLAFNVDAFKFWYTATREGGYLHDSADVSVWVINWMVGPLVSFQNALGLILIYFQREYNIWIYRAVQIICKRKRTSVGESRNAAYTRDSEHTSRHVCCATRTHLFVMLCRPTV